VRAFQRAIESEHANLEDIRKRLAQFCTDYLLESLPDRRELYDQVHAAVNEEPRILDPAVADVLCRCALRLLPTDLAYYKEFRLWKSKLGSEARTHLTREAIAALRDDEGWIQGLDLISADVANDETLRGDQIPVRELFDHSFAAIEKKGIEALGAVLNLLSFLNSQQLREYIDRTLDTS
jgi:hypothetical protein